MKKRQRGFISWILASCILLFLAVSPLFAEAGVAAVSAGIAPCVEDLMSSFVANGGQPMALVKEATGPLAQQIDRGAPYDLLIAADPEWPQWLKERGKLKNLTVCAQGFLVLWSPSQKPIALEKLDSLRLATPNPETTSHGKLAKSYLEKRGLWAKALEAHRLIISDSAPAAVLAVKGGSADAAFIPLSLAKTLGGSVTSLPVDPTPTVVGLNAAGANENAVKFWKFLQSPKAASIWAKWGFRPLSAQ